MYEFVIKIIDFHALYSPYVQIDVNTIVFFLEYVSFLKKYNLENLNHVTPGKEKS